MSESASVAMGCAPDLIPSEERVEQQAGIGKLVGRQRVHLLDAARVRRARLPEVRHARVVTRAIDSTVGIFRAHAGDRWVRQILVYCVQS